MNQVVDEDSKKGVYIVLGAALLLVTLGIFSPKSQTVETVATPPRVAQKIIVKTEIKPKNRKVEEAKPQRQQVVVQEDVKPAGPPKAEMPTSGAGGGSRISKMMRTVAGGRISLLIGKVSAQGAKSANVVFATGTKLEVDLPGEPSLLWDPQIKPEKTGPQIVKDLESLFLRQVVAVEKMLQEWVA